jgi:hypothetical protein
MDRYQRMILNNSPDSCSNWGEINSTGINTWKIAFSFYINNLHKTRNDNTGIIPFVDDTSILITSPNPTNLKKKKVLIKFFRI